MKNLKFFLALFICSQFFQRCSRVTPETNLLVTLQPDNNPNEWLLIKSGQKIIADSHATDFAAASWTMGGFPVHIYGSVKFDLSQLPHGASIVSAKLSLFSNPTPSSGDRTHANFGKNNGLVIQRITAPWNGPSETQNIPETDSFAEIKIPPATRAGEDLSDVDVTSMVKEMRKHGNNGFFIKMQADALYRSRIFCSSKHEIAERHPMLVIVYKF
jgi:hypothetical protein